MPTSPRWMRPQSTRCLLEPTSSCVTLLQKVIILIGKH
uniref:Caspase 6 n=1 Tax=Molossus molossus TaxID=27622 RepID=A0A7J8JRA1_MOLMO|nr:caspase 6 [Molossus molossus]